MERPVDNYDELKNKIADYVTMDDVKEDQETISAYTLINTLDGKFKELRDIFDTNALLKKINSKNRFRNLFNNNKCDSVFLESAPLYNDKIDTLCMSFIFKESGLKKVNKKIGDNNIYSIGYDETLDLDIFDTCLDEIAYDFNKLEEFVSLFREDKYGCKYFDREQFIRSEDFNILINYYASGAFKYTISFNNIVDPYNIQTETWFTRDPIFSIIEKNKDDILRKIPVNVNELDPTCRRIVMESLNEKENKNDNKKNKVKTLQ